MAQRLSCDLAAHGLVIVSGMARGVDTQAHKGALEGKGKTIAVWGTGIDVPYPRDNKKLSEQIIESGGAIVSEFAVGTFAAPQNFPIRNRIISGLAIGVLVVEAGEYSGTRITARNALEQGRDIYAVPGNVTNRNSWGPNTLIKQGAKLVATWEDVWEELPSDVKVPLQAQFAPATESQETASLFPVEQLSPNEKKVLRLLKQDEATQLDELIEALDGQVSSSEIFAALFELELVGKVKQLPGKNYVKSF
jgi:DNA processing protein